MLLNPTPFKHDVRGPALGVRVPRNLERQVAKIAKVAKGWLSAFCTLGRA